MKPGDPVLYPKFWGGSQPDQNYTAVLKEIRDNNAVIEVYHNGLLRTATVTLSDLKPNPTPNVLSP